MRRTKPDTDRIAALGRLLAVIHAYTEGGQFVPCTSRSRGHLWLSERQDEREAAAHGCARCPALAACGEYVDAYPEPAGVWAGWAPVLHRIKGEG